MCWLTSLKTLLQFLKYRRASQTREVVFSKFGNFLPLRKQNTLLICLEKKKLFSDSL